MQNSSLPQDFPKKPELGTYTLNCGSEFEYQRAFSSFMSAAQNYEEQAVNYYKDNYGDNIVKIKLNLVLHVNRA